MRALFLLLLAGCVIPTEPVSDVYLAEITAYDPSAGSTTTLRYSTHGFCTLPSETPASTFYDARIKQPASVKRDLFQSGTTQGRSRIGFGDLILANDDGGLDALANYGLDGRAITIRRGERGASYPSGFTTVLVGTMEQAEFSVNEVRIKLRDKQFDLQSPLQTTKYAGTNTLPSGLEGVSDLKGKPKPVCYGQVTNVPAVCVNTSKLIYQVADAACSSIDSVYDKGIPLTINLPLTIQTAIASAGVAMTFGGAQFVSVGSSGNIHTSPDGTNWTSQTSTFAGSHARAVAYNGSNLYVMGGDSGNLATSPDGITWTSRTSTFGATVIYAVTYGNGLWVIGGASGTMATSPDGITWTPRTSGFGATDIKALAFGNGLYVAAGNSGTVTTSPDGTTWTSRTSTIAGNISAATYGGKLFVIVGASGAIASSPDGKLWTSRTSGTTSTLWCVTYGAGQFIIGGFSDELIFSSDGLSYSGRLAGMGSQILTVAYGNNTLVATNLSATQVFASTRAADYASLADLSDDTLAPAPGTFKSYPTGGYFRLGSSPAGAVTADVTQGSTSADRTAAQVWKAILTRAGKSASDYSAADITALDTLNSSVVGYFANEETTYADALDQVADSVGAWSGPDRSGIYRIQQFGEIPNAPLVSITANDMLKPIERISTQDPDKGLPSYRTIVRYAKNYTVQTTDLAAGVTDDRRTIVGNEWREASYTDSTIQTRNLLAVQLDSDSLLTTETAALAEATRRQKLRGRKRDRYALTLHLDSETEVIDLGSVVRITHSRYGLSGGECFRVLSVDPDIRNRTLALTVWGPHAPPNSGGIGFSVTLSGTGTVT